MKKFLRKLFLFVAVYSLIALVFDRILRWRIDDHYELQYREVIHPEKRAEAIILGTSHATHGIRPVILDSLGLTFYNFSLNGSSPRVLVRWYKNLFSRYYPTPKYCILAVEWFFLGDDWVWRQYEQDSEYFPLRVFLENLMEFQEYDASKLLLHRFPISKYRKRLFTYVFRPHDYSPLIMSEYDDGYVPYEPGENDLWENPFLYTSNPEQRAAFEELIGLLMADGIQLIFVNLPEYGENGEYYAEHRTRLYGYFEALAREHAIPFLNYNVERRLPLNSDKRCFADWGHLNSRGSMEFTKILREDVRRIWRDGGPRACGPRNRPSSRTRDSRLGQDR